MPTYLENAQMSPRESIEHEWYVEEARLAREHAVTIKQLELKEQQLEAKWGAWLRIPLVVIKLPVYVVLALGLLVAYAKGVEPNEEFWRLFR